MVRVARVDGADNNRSVATICGAFSAGGHTRRLIAGVSLTMIFFALQLIKLTILYQLINIL